jgi:DNA-binding beta-propeller fold protein YncE
MAFLRHSALSLCLAAAGLVPVAAQAQTSQYTLVKTIDLPGTKGGHGDWVAYDKDTHAVWLSQSPDHNVVVIDAKTMTVKKTLHDVDSGNGLTFDGDHAYVADATAGKLIVYNKRTFVRLASVDSGGKTPDGVNVDTKTGKVLVANDDSNNEVVFDPKSPFKLVASYKLEPKDDKDGPDVGVYVASTNRLYQPVGSKIDVINPDTNQIETVWDFGLKSDAKGGVYDSKTNHLIIGTGDKKMLVIDPSTGKLVTTIAVAGAVDETAIDTAARRAYIGDKTGNLEVVDLDTNQVIGHIQTEPKVHTLTVDPANHRVFVYLNASNKVGVYEQKS